MEYKEVKKLYQLITGGEITLAGNKKLQIYGTFKCKSGKRMNAINRVFFASEQAARDAGYRPCGHCMHEAYLHWKKEQ